MTFHELAQTLPNGFHDAELRRFEMDYSSRRMTLDLMVWIGDMADAARRELYRPARVTLEQVAFLAIEPPDTRHDWVAPGAVVIDAGDGHPREKAYSLPDPPSGTSATWVYLGATNSFLHVAAREASLTWTGTEENRG